MEQLNLRHAGYGMDIKTRISGIPIELNLRDLCFFLRRKLGVKKITYRQLNNIDDNEILINGTYELSDIRELIDEFQLI